MTTACSTRDRARFQKTVEQQSYEELAADPIHRWRHHWGGELSALRAWRTGRPQQAREQAGAPSAATSHTPCARCDAAARGGRHRANPQCRAQLPCGGEDGGSVEPGYDAPPVSRGRARRAMSCRSSGRNSRRRCGSAALRLPRLAAIPAMSRCSCACRWGRTRRSSASLRRGASSRVKTGPVSYDRQ